MTPSALIVDDNRALAENLGEILESEGFTVRVFFDPLTAVAESVALSFDVALIDVRMPKMDGVDLFRALVATHPASAFILMSAYADDQRISDAKAGGVHSVLSKPVSVKRLLEVLHAVSTRPGSHA